MNPAIQDAVLLTISGAAVDLLVMNRPSTSDETDVQLLLIAALMQHGVIAESVEEIATLAASDIENCFKGTPVARKALDRVKERTGELATKLLTNAMKDYRYRLMKRDINPDELPKVATPPMPKVGA